MDNKQIDNKDTEQCIFQAAMKVFQKKGCSGARMQEIADEAGINKSMLHYYFRNKEKLFKEVFGTAIVKFAGNIFYLLNADNTWEEKIKGLCDYYMEFVNENPLLPNFMINEMTQQPDAYFSLVHSDKKDLRTTRFYAQLKDAMQKGEIRNVDPVHVFQSLLSGVMFPYISAPMTKKSANVSDEEWPQFLEDRKDMVIDMMIVYLKTK